MRAFVKEPSESTGFFTSKHVRLGFMLLAVNIFPYFFGDKKIELTKLFIVSILFIIKT